MKRDALARQLAEVIDALYSERAAERSRDRRIELIEKHIKHAYDLGRFDKSQRNE